MQDWFLAKSVNYVERIVIMDIDVVIPWVDPSDKAWIESKNKYLGIEDLNKIDNSNNRFRDWKILNMYFVG